MRRILFCVCFLFIIIFGDSEISVSQKRIACPKSKLPNVPNGKFQKFARLKNERRGIKGIQVAVFSCEKGFGLAQNSSLRIFCKNGKWSNRIPLCIKKTEVSEIFNNKSIAEETIHLNNNSIINIKKEIDFTKQLFKTDHSKLPQDIFNFDQNIPRDERNNFEYIPDKFEVLCIYKFIDSSKHLECVCPSGYTLSQDGQTCRNLDECKSGLHNCYHLCIDNPGSFTCSCNPGYMFGHDGKSCQDIDECENESSCQQICKNYPGNYKCECDVGFQLSVDNETCLDVNECMNENGNCSHLCANSVGSYQCACPDGFVLTEDGKNCKRNYACSINNGGCSHFCSDISGFPKCSCPFDMVLENDVNCFQRKPCSAKQEAECYSCNVGKKNLLCFCPTLFNDSSICPKNYDLFDQVSCRRMSDNVCSRYNENGISKECVLLDENQVCLCPEDFYIHKGKCVPNDPCFINNGGCSHICESEKEQVTCKCPSGLVLRDQSCVKEYSCEEGSPKCSNTNSCADKNGGCSHFCEELENIVKCSCPERLFLVGKLCLEQNPCSLDNNGCSQFCNISEYSNEPYCSCKSGFTLDVDQKTCIDVDECQNYHHCSDICRNTFGSYICDCPEGYKILQDGTSCKKINESVLFIKCPNDGVLNYTLPPNQSSMNVELPQPLTSVNWWSQVSSEPFWGKFLNYHLPVGETKIIFKATDNKINLSESCTLIIKVIDEEAPMVHNCPSDIIEKVEKHEKPKKITWIEPIFTDNVNVVSIFRSKKHGSDFYVGREEVVYEAIDDAGNKAVCKFFVELKEDRNNNELMKSFFYKNVLICPSGVKYMSKSPDYYDLSIIRSFGCHWKYAKIYKTSKNQWSFGNNFLISKITNSKKQN